MEVGTLNRCLSADGRAPVVWAGRRNVTSLHPESVPFGAADLGGAGCVSRAPVRQGLALLPGGSVVQRASKRSGRVGTPVSLSPRAAFALRPPPYKMDALEPLMSKRTLEYHWGKHHKGYYDNLNKQIEGTDLGGNTLEEIIKLSYNNGNPLPVFNNAGQAWNHDFFWQSMRPGGGGKPSGEILKLIERDFGSFEQFVSEFKQAGATQFGSGWAWLALKKEKLVVEKTANAFNPLIWGHIPLLTMDVWEHAYYLDYQNRRADYINTFVDKLISWEEVTARLQRAKAFVNLGEPKIPEE